MWRFFLLIYTYVFVHLIFSIVKRKSIFTVPSALILNMISQYATCIAILIISVVTILSLTVDEHFKLNVLDIISSFSLEFWLTLFIQPIFILTTIGLIMARWILSLKKRKNKDNRGEQNA